jgi:hypothetical protein
MACWYSHVSVMRLTANRLLPESERGGSDAAVILEDDIDMELDSRDAAGCRTSYALVPRTSVDRS